MIQTNGSIARCIVAVLCLTCLFPILKVSAQQKDGAISDQPKMKLCESKQTAKVVIFGKKERNVDPCEYVKAVTASGITTGSYHFFKKSNDAHNLKLTESGLRDEIMSSTGASEKTSRSIARFWIKMLGTREFKSLTVIGMASGATVAVYETFKASNTKVQDINASKLPSTPTDDTKSDQR
jgi:hypothetical protein